MISTVFCALPTPWMELQEQFQSYKVSLYVSKYPSIVGSYALCTQARVSEKALKFPKEKSEVCIKGCG